MRGLALRGLAALTAVAAAAPMVGCTDTAPTGRPVYATAGSGGGGMGGAGGQPASETGAAGAGGGSAGTTATGLAGRGAAGAAASGQGGAGGGPSGLAPPAGLGLASLNSDYSTTSVSLLNVAGGVVKGSCVHSTNVGTGTSKTISGDAVLPSQPQRGGQIVVVDRGNGALTFVDPAGCFITRQIAIPGGAKTDPHDVVIVSDQKAYVTRYQANLTATSAQQLGNDVVALDPTTGTFLARVNLDPYASTGAGAGVLARPDRAVLADGKVVVSLNQIDATYTTYGDGAVVIIDPATDSVVSKVSLPGLFDCEGMDFVPASHTLLVSCGGIYAAQDQPLQSGVAVVDLAASPPRLDHVVSSVAFDGRPMNFGWVLAAPAAGAPNRAFAGTYDPDGVTADAVFQFDFATGAVTPVAAGAPFSLGAPALASALLFLPEAPASSPKIQLFDVSGSPQAISAFTPDMTSGLPPRQVAWY